MKRTAQKNGNPSRPPPVRVLMMISSMRGGGSERQTLHLLRSLDRDRFEPHLFLLEATGELLNRIPNDVTLHRCEAMDRSIGMNYPGKILHRQSTALGKLLQRENIDVIYDRTFHMTMIAAKAALNTGVPRVSTIVSPPDLALPMVETKFIGLKKWRLAKAYRQAFRVIAVSQIAANSATRYYDLNPESLTVIPNPVPEIALDPTFRLPSHPPDSCSLVCVGRMTAEKGHRELIQALRMLESGKESQKIRVHLLGDGPLREELETLANRLTRHQVIFHGHRDNPCDWIAAADGLILPSIFEGMPNVVLEAMKIQTPVIATRAGGTAELQREEPTAFWADPKDAASLSIAIAEFVRHPQRRKNHCEAAKRMVDTHHGLAKTTRKIESILSEAVVSS